MFALLLPSLYAHVELKSFARCNACLAHLVSRPDAARYVRTLILRPNHFKESIDYDDIEQHILLEEALEVVIPKLQSLHRFQWDSLDLPNDQIWLSMRNQYVVFITPQPFDYEEQRTYYLAAVLT